jgi:NhaA family Na+:H+ antiporter
VVRPLQEFTRLEAAGGIVLLLATAAALIWANAGPVSYADFWDARVVLRVGDFSFDEDLRHVVNDGLMAIFFLVIGLEIKRELTIGELSERSVAVLPAAAALGGMAVPALIFLAITGSGSDARGWGIPMATDIAFALGVLSLLGRRVPNGLTVLLLAVAVIDDIGAIIVIALFYSGPITAGWLAGAVAGLAAMAALWRVGVRHLVPYVLLGLVVWVCTLESGVHATIAGVAIGLLTPVRPFQAPAAVSREAERIAAETSDAPPDPDADAEAWRRLAWVSREAISPASRLQHALHPWTSMVILPVFALANAGVYLRGGALGDAAHSAVALGIVLGLVVGKPVGLCLGAFLAVRTGLGRLPAGCRARHVAGIGAVAGIGFTVSLFITDLAYDDPSTIASAKVGILAASAIAALAGAAILLAVRRRA